MFQKHDKIFKTIEITFIYASQINHSPMIYANILLKL